MCGISGIITSHNIVVNLKELRIMRDQMKHRGPDGFGEYIDNNKHVGLGHRRLKIIDLSDAAKQPMTNQAKTLWITFNGEIYNYLELKSLLIERGYKFISSSDTEVILNAYEEWGIDCLQKFIGIFAFCLWDQKKQVAFIVRDHLGVKPLYYYVCKDRFLFASEQKAILAVVPESRQPNYDAVFEFLAFTRYDHDEDSIFKGIKQLKAGHYILVETNNWNEPKQKRYWNVSAEKSRDTYNYRDPIETFDKLFEESIKLQLRSDVPIGTFLSGGLDSSSIVAIVSEQVVEPMRTYSVTYSEPKFNEKKYIDLMVATFPVMSFFTEPDSGKLWSSIERFVWAQEIPTVGPGPFSEYCVAELAAGDVTVLLNGQGPDEILGGYHHCYESYLNAKFHRFLRRPNIHDLNGIIHELFLITKVSGKNIPYLLLAGIMPKYEETLRALKKLVRMKGMSSGFLEQIKNKDPDFYFSFDASTIFDNRLARLTYRDVLPALLHYADRNCMAFSLEGRVPFLDHRIVEFCNGLDLSWKIRDGRTKYLLRKTMESKLPAEVTWRWSKMGFETPAGLWFRQKKGILLDILSEESIKRRGILKPKVVKRVLRQHLNCEKDHTWEIWRWLTLELWFKQFIDRFEVQMVEA